MLLSLGAIGLFAGFVRGDRHLAVSAMVFFLVSLCVVIWSHLISLLSLLKACAKGYTLAVACNLDSDLK